MASGQLSQKLSRDQIAAIVGNNPRAVKVLENLLADVAGAIPDMVVGLSGSAEYLELGPTVAMEQTISELASMIGAQDSRCAQLEARVSELASLVDGLMLGVEV